MFSIFFKKSLIVIFCLISISIFSIVIVNQYYKKKYNIKSTTIILEKGLNEKQIAKKLYNQNIIPNTNLFLLIKRIKSYKAFQAGEYYFSGYINIQDIIRKLTNGDIVIHKITFPEGLTNAEIVAKLNKIENLTGNITNYYEEGYLLPESYNYIYATPKQEIIDRMYNSMKLFLDKLWNQRQEDLPYKNIHQALTMASIIEKESAISNERKKISGVFVNRLKLGMKLQADPTILYAMKLDNKNFNGQVLKKDLTYPSKYNTYKYPGLPPGPISNPGKESIIAAFNPERTKELFFVVDGNGGHNFAINFSQHKKNIIKYQTLKKQKND